MQAYLDGYFEEHAMNKDAWVCSTARIGAHTEKVSFHGVVF